MSRCFTRVAVASSDLFLQLSPSEFHAFFHSHLLTQLDSKQQDSVAKRDCLAAVFHQFCVAAVGKKLTVNERENAALLRSFLRDSDSKLVRKYAMACVRILFSSEEGQGRIWSDFLLVLEALEGTQV